jgi:hypothetical protein
LAVAGIRAEAVTLNCASNAARAVGQAPAIVNSWCPAIIVGRAGLSKIVYANARGAAQRAHVGGDSINRRCHYWLGKRRLYTLVIGIGRVRCNGETAEAEDDCLEHVLQAPQGSCSLAMRVGNACRT